MPYVTLQEASEIVLRETEVDITVPQLIRAGAVNGLPMCVLLDVECYSPTHQMRREKKAEEQDPEYWGKVRPKSDGELDYAYGCFVLPPRHVFAFQTKDTVRIDAVTSLDGNETYYPGVDIRRDELQIMLPHLGKFIAHIKASQSKAKPTPAGTPGSDSPQEKQAISGVDRSDSAGMVAWHGDIIENKVEILNKYGDAFSARDLMSWCKANGSEDVFKRDQPKNRDSLQWIDSYAGDVHSVTYKTVSSQLSIWRKEGIFPPRK